VRLHYTTPTPQLGSCRGLSFRADASSVEARSVDYGETKGGTYTIEALRGWVQVEELAAVGSSRRAEVAACDQRWELGPEQREVLATFARVFKARMPEQVPGKAEAEEAEGVEGIEQEGEVPAEDAD
ncbi:MAG: hypothetical protein ACOC1F_07680, partial [Myxococcota bacterium]